MNDERPTPPTTDKRVVNAQATVRKLKRLGVETRGLPSGIVRQRQKLREICKLHGVEPEYEV
ncbi:hypothetical protein [Mesorhizobium sp. WSM2239]|uniref:Uncharacterized protein n=2 Tax=unclassified Mesorhizobium TaxID=325217 RepID=A0AAU8DB48_9HYPH